MNTHEDIFLKARRIADLGERASFLDQACANDATLRARVDDLLRNAKSADAYFEVVQAFAPQPLQPQSADRIIGRYKLLEKIGEGGMGVVYMAEQREPVTRKVALKVIKAGMDTRQVIARFEAERQALALMDHPNIARVLDGGETGSGRPYFVMDLVQGLPITRFCDEAKLPMRERLKLFLDVCSAIQHAHQKGIIHRDIKPSNILVTVHGDRPVPKVIDFGVAKATQQPLTEKTLFTQFQHFIGTPAYMSPEQASLNGLDIDTRSDIYGLGVLLYELLTGATPFESDELLRSGLDEMRRVIREKEPSRPSTKVSSMGREALSTTAERRRVDPPNFVELLRGDLDWIVLKAIEKDRTRRYETANGLAADVRRHLNDEPVTARPPTAAYRLQKAFLRNRRAFTAGAIFLGLLMLAIVLTTWQAVRATRAEKKESMARRQAELNERRAQEAQAREAGLRTDAQTQASSARRRAYAADMNLAQAEAERGDKGFAAVILRRHIPTEGQDDLRGWEWRYIWQNTQNDVARSVPGWTNGGFVYDIKVSPDGRWLARAFEGDLLLSQLPDGNVTRTELANCGVEHLAFVDSRFLALSCFESNQWSVRLWDLLSQRTVYAIPLAGICQGVATARNGEWLFTWSKNSEGGQDVVLRQSADGRMLKSWPTPDGIRWMNLKRPFAVSNDGKLVAHRIWPNSIRVFSAETGETLWTAKAKVEMISVLCFSADGALLASSGAYAASPVQLWSVAIGRERASLDGHQGWVRDLAFTADGRRLVSSGDGTIRVWDVAAGGIALKLQGGGRAAFIPGEKTLVSARSSGGVDFYDLAESRRPVNPVAVGEAALAWAFAEDSRSIVTIAANGTVSRWLAPDFRSKDELFTTTIRPREAVISSNGRAVAASDGNGAVEVWSIDNRERRNRFLADRYGPCAAELSADGRFLMTIGVSNRLVKVWRVDSAEEISSRPAAERLNCLSPDGSFLLAIDAKRTTTMRVLATGREQPLEWDIWGPGYSHQFSPDGRWFTYCDGSGHFYDTRSNTPRTRLDSGTFGQVMISLGFSADLTRYATGGTGAQSIKIWSMEGNLDLLTLASPGSVFMPVAFSPDGNMVAGSTSGGVSPLPEGGTVYVWRAPSWAQIEAAEHGRPGR